MRKNVVRLTLVLLVCISIFVVSSKVSANTIKQVDMNVYIDKNGNASITEVWTAELSEGTEGYRKFSKLENKTISNFSVTDETGKEYTNLVNWNSNDSFTAKAYKCGINENKNELELCWGISKYGNKKYTLKYDIINLVTQFGDYQGIYFNFFNIDEAVNNVKITIKSDYYFSDKTETVWNFGNKGVFTFENGSIVINSNGKVYIDDYFSELIKFGENYFKSYDISNKTFDTILQDAKKDNNNFGEIIWTIVGILIVILLISPWIIYPLLPKIKKYNYKIKRKRYLKKIGEALPSNSKIDYYTALPCDGDILKTYFLIHYYKISIKGNTDIIGTLLLKWKMENNIEFFYDDENEYCIDFGKVIKLDNELENSLFKGFVNIAGEDKILKLNKMKKVSMKDFYSIYYWKICLYSRLEKQLFEKGLMKKNKNEYKPTQELRQEAINLKGFIKYLNNLNNSQDNVLTEDISGQYMLFAYLLGNSKKTYEYLSKNYPSKNIYKIKETEEDYSIRSQRAANWILRDIWGYVEKKYNSYKNDNYNSQSEGGNHSSGGSSAGGSSGGGFR